MEEGPGKSGKFPPVQIVEDPGVRKAVFALALGAIVQSIAAFVLVVRSGWSTVGALLLLSGGVLGFGAMLHLRRRP